MAVLASTSILRPTDAAKMFMQRVSELIGQTLQSKEATWFLDQIVLGHAVRELGQEQVRIGQLDQTYLDWFFGDDTLVWTAKGKRKSEDGRFIAEVDRYRFLQRHADIAKLMPEDIVAALNSASPKVAAQPAAIA